MSGNYDAHVASGFEAGSLYLAPARVSSGRKRLDFDAEGLTAEFEAVREEAYKDAKTDAGTECWKHEEQAREETVREIAAWVKRAKLEPGIASQIERGDWKKKDE